MTATAIDIDRARTALWALDAGVDRHQWVRIGCAAKAAGLTFEDFNDWSATAGNYGGQGDTSDAWKSFKQDGGVNAGTLFHLARQTGWADPASDNKPQRDAKRAAPLSEWWGRGLTATADHGYITRKQGTPDGLRLVSWPLQGWAAFKGRSLEGWLMVPVRTPNGDLASIQFIGTNGGEKLNAFGCPMAGTFTVGTLEHGAPAYIGEGIGHAWSLNEVTGHAAVVSFGAANIEKAAATIKAAGAVPVIVADRGKEGDARAAALRQDCKYVTLPADMASGADVNDLHLERGADAVREVLSRATMQQANDNGRDDARRRRQQDENARLQEAEHDTEPPSLSVDEMMNDCVWIASGSQVGRISNPKWVLPFSEFCDLTASCASRVEGDDGRRRRVLHAVTWKQSRTAKPCTHAHSTPDRPQSAPTLTA
ncbi:PriCT-2 domain-containing protein [Cupriavidus campinensis]|uniref:PriCT-2 domain-containing protein n=1 Tax=Cupriavidus campinensis TaxID=151783 RepID=A0AAE9I172_9BURK|nr:PriCT-2 domain-containing protein [Cupriavidus campinensis]URF05274.1 PriCT-2 domain-containing protein [Cupriavidus campinensis]